mmetsp:Transcript_20448/g.33755  ORF Transcript_20448/g.33755 Transcript_20448/m.33755 type:complete len:82 (-) Transcript_20448:80-325(-)
MHASIVYINDLGICNLCGVNSARIQSETSGVGGRLLWKTPSCVTQRPFYNVYTYLLARARAHALWWAGAAVCTVRWFYHKT